MSFRNSSYSNSLFSNSGTNGNSVFNSRRRGNRRVIVQQSSLKYQLKRFEIVVNSTYDNVITKAFKLYIEPLGTAQYNLIPNSSSIYFNIVNPLKILSKIPEYEIIIKYILNAVMAAGNVRRLYDKNTNLENKILTLNQDIEDIRLGITEDIVNTVGTASISIKYRLTPLMTEYIQQFGFPDSNGIDTIRLYMIKDDLISKGIDPYKYPD
tara:strand:- start:8302 stop:8931 length:630 start_codon:yes stop_codon:yes gene_type:complete